MATLSLELQNAQGIGSRVLKNIGSSRQNTASKMNQPGVVKAPGRVTVDTVPHPLPD